METTKEAMTSAKKPRVVWSRELHQEFVEVVDQLGFEKAVPKKILERMNNPNLSRENIASHLHKYRLYLRRINETPQQRFESYTTRQACSNGFPQLSHASLTLQMMPRPLSIQAPMNTQHFQPSIHQMGPNMSLQVGEEYSTQLPNTPIPLRSFPASSSDAQPLIQACGNVDGLQVSDGNPCRFPSMPLPCNSLAPSCYGNLRRPILAAGPQGVMPMHHNMFESEHIPPVSTQVRMLKQKFAIEDEALQLGRSDHHQYMIVPMRRCSTTIPFESHHDPFNNNASACVDKRIVSANEGNDFGHCLHITQNFHDPPSADRHDDEGKKFEGMFSPRCDPALFVKQLEDDRITEAFKEQGIGLIESEPNSDGFSLDNILS